MGRGVTYLYPVLERGVGLNGSGYRCTGIGRGLRVVQGATFHSNLYEISVGAAAGCDLFGRR
ncbi:hypothetical protein D3C84_1219520 [compost metagenome]